MKIVITTLLALMPLATASSPSNVVVHDNVHEHEPNPSLAKRWFKACDSIVGQTVCDVFVSGIRSAIVTISYISKKKPCGAFSGYAGSNNEVRYTFRSNLKDCDTSFEQDNIARALKHQIVDRGDKICETQCLDLTEKRMGWIPPHRPHRGL
ncbi:hypothetical protein FALBO_11103 [Fusarium albosuccineum]|uniref:Secreted protein CSS2 C-terminal domain-containing protein n=1 Tax=Fusarium albosuccineum TaxID=1237068 RepID=A0A8H4PAD5_9HYPO|nr:hypothetical protein FALBO_11103 [Fusarium albosuccineum]